jgi:N-acetylmuramoyl-L-alanine amidase
MAPDRKADPSRRFDWRRLAQSGLSVWVDGARGAGTADPRAFRAAAARFGYRSDDERDWTMAAVAVARAFRRRFRPWDAAEGPLDEAGLAQLQGLAERWPARR